jgi:hypothetical protein
MRKSPAALLRELRSNHAGDPQSPRLPLAPCVYEHSGRRQAPHRSTDEFSRLRSFHRAERRRDRDRIDRAKAFYVDNAGFEELVDVTVGETTRVVQLTPHGSGCAIALMDNTPMAPGSIYGLHLIVPDIEAVRAELVGRGVEVSGFFHFGPTGEEPGLAPGRPNYNSFASFRDPDGNTWLVQEVDRSKAA